MEADASVRQQHSANQDAAYAFRNVISNVPLSAEEEDDARFITCVEFWDGNLYIGTSAGELLHYVSLPPEDGSTTGQPTFILASRLEPPYTTTQDSPFHTPGVQQIVLLPSVSKACIPVSYTHLTLPTIYSV